MISFNQYITEVFDNPYNWSGGSVSKGSITPENDGVPEYYIFEPKSGVVKLTANHWWLDAGMKFSASSRSIIKKSGHTIALEFTKKTSSEYGTYDMTADGDAMRTMATVLDIIKSIIKKHKPTTIVFSGDKSEYKSDRSSKEKTGRTKAYSAMVKRFAGKYGYESDTSDSSRKIDWQLTKK